MFLFSVSGLEIDIELCYLIFIVWTHFLISGFRNCFERGCPQNVKLMLKQIIVFTILIILTFTMIGILFLIGHSIFMRTVVLFNLFSGTWKFLQVLITWELVNVLKWLKSIRTWMNSFWVHYLLKEWKIYNQPFKTVTIYNLMFNNFFNFFDIMNNFGVASTSKLIKQPAILKW